MHELVEKARNGCSEAFMTAVGSMKELMFRTAYMQLGNEYDALDAVQEALAKAFSGIGSLRQPGFFKTWLVRILLNECHNIHKYRSKVLPMEKEYFDASAAEVSGEDEILDRIGNAEVKAMLGKLDTACREVIDLRYNHGMKLDEIAQVMKIPKGTVKSRLNRAHQLLRKQYFEREVLL